MAARVPHLRRIVRHDLDPVDHTADPGVHPWTLLMAAHRSKADDTQLDVSSKQVLLQEHFVYIPLPQMATSKLRHVMTKK